MEGQQLSVTCQRGNGRCSAPERASSERRASAGGTDGGVLGQQAREFAQMVATSDYPVLLEGETGVGKTHLARSIHALSNRRNRELVHVNCGGMPESLFESQMFGHVRGAFTDAKETHEGFFECAHLGTLFLDEIGDLPPTAQPKLLTALEQKAIRKVGATHEIHVDARLIAATNADLAGRVRDGRFREDLYHRCAVLTCRLPALRERTSDLPGIILAFFRDVVGSRDTRRELDDDARSALCEYRWPDNLRELSNVLRRAAVLAGEGDISPRHLPEHVTRRHGAPAAAREPESRRPRYEMPESRGEERARIIAALKAHRGNRTRAARNLGMSRSTLWAKLQRFGIDGERPDVERAVPIPRAAERPNGFGAAPLVQ